MNTDQVYSLSFNNTYQIVEKNQNTPNLTEYSQTVPDFKNRTQQTSMYSLNFNKKYQITDNNLKKPNLTEYSNGDCMWVPETKWKKIYFNGFFPEQGVGSYANPKN